MKKIILITMLWGIIIVGLTGCGKTNNNLKIGDTLTANIFDFTLNDIQFTKYVETTSTSPDFYLPSESENEYFYGVDGQKYKNDYGVAEDGKVFVSFEFKLKYTGKKDYKGYFENIMELEYGEGYTFDVNTMYINYNNTWTLVDGEPINHSSLKFETLDNTTYIGRGYFEVPEEIEKNTNESLKLKITGLGKDATYIIR